MPMGRGVRVAGLVAILAAACSTTVAGEGQLAPGALVPARISASAPSSSTPTTAAPPTTRPPTPQPPPPGTIPAAFAGTWSGPVVQPRSVIPRWTAVLSLPVGRRAGTFMVAGHCSGPATVISAARTKLVLREVISSDPANRCAASGLVTLTPTSGGRLRMSWVDTDHATNTGSGVLSRA